MTASDRWHDDKRLMPANTDHLFTPVDWFHLLYLCVVSFPDNPTPEEEAVGEVSIQVDLFTHPGTGEHKITVKGMSLFVNSCD